MKPTVTIIGAGISGLSAAIHLQRQGFAVKILEASDRAGGRIKTDVVKGFLLDRGFQVLLTSYPEAKELLDYDSLNLKRFLPGATVLYDGGTFEIADPFRRPSALLATAFAPVGSLKDKANTFFLKKKLVSKSIETLFAQKQQSSYDQLKAYGFSQKMIDRFFKPFFSGIFLEDDLQTPNRMFDFVMKMFSEGDAAVPALGMEEIPKQLVKQLPDGCIQYNTAATAIEGNTIITANGEKIISDTILIATEANRFIAKYKPEITLAHQSVTNVYFETLVAPSDKAVVILNASSNRQIVNNLTVMSNVSKQYAPDGKVLVSVSCNGILGLSEQELIDKIKSELTPWFGQELQDWELLKSYEIQYALPKLKELKDDVSLTDVKLADNLYCCGDHLMNGSINAAIKSGRLVATFIANENNKI
ncbi:protoporphyrinogen/coproporphyrinogen oxidase [Flavobacterium muglaense]|uniref:FAD-dependent oxidoreductase n=1 Tax=Flavobacterium muglaense TaxID=2764716 RepID=A0A923N1C0_9FLAO|nr:NAD(P)/FAD-dependent oxidoreductase [Flavobacterium muglaense]MBC5839012.1 FAD-dependent oxidoreductase [Flavobacterium muglaense]MBC5845514.1 FAD-dependent oxidoreductase [Flavobacterium muglaense]